jgi:hypothetical protein
MIKKITALLMLSFCMVCCRQPKECTNIVKAPQPFLDYYYFPNGSYWVYRLESDSAVVYTVTIETKTPYYAAPG